MNNWKPTWKDEVERAYRRAAVLIDLDQDPPTKKEHLTCKEVRMIIDDLVKAHDKQREELKSQLSETVDDWYSKAPAYRNKAELKGMLHDLLTKLEKE